MAPATSDFDTTLCWLIVQHGWFAGRMARIVSGFSWSCMIAFPPSWPFSELVPISLIHRSETLVYKGSLVGHKGWVTAIATSQENPDLLLTASRGEYFVLLEALSE